MEEMYQMDFEEFLLALGNEMWINEIKNAYKEMRETSIHDHLLDLYRKYLCIGGMPESVKRFIEVGQDILLYNKKYLKEIRKQYLLDMTRYVFSKSESVKIEEVYKSIPLILGKENNKFTYSDVSEGGSLREYKTPISWLLASHLVYKTNQIKRVEIPLKAFEDQNSFKLYLNDVGIFTSMLDIDFSNILLDKEFMYKGAITENYVAQCLKINDYPLYFWRSKNTAEIDFLIETKDRNNTYRGKSG